MARDKEIARQSTGKKINKTDSLMAISSNERAAPQQAEMDLRIEKQVERDGIEMGVLSDGTAFLSGRGLARLCGVAHSRIGEILSEWSSTPQKPRITRIKEILSAQGLHFETPIIAALEIEEHRRMLGQIRFVWLFLNTMHGMLSKVTESRHGIIIDY